MSDASPKRRILHSAAGPLLWALLFAALFLCFYVMQKPSALVVSNETIKGIFSTYGIAVGPVLALLVLLALYVLAGIKRLIGLRRFRVLNPVLLLVVMTPFAGFGWQLLYREKPYTDIARAIIGSLAFPLFAASVAVCVLGLVWLAWTLVRR